MDISGRQKNKLSLAGLILSVIPIALLVIYIISKNEMVLYTFLICGALLPVPGLILSIIGMFSARKNGTDGAGIGFVGTIISSIEFLSVVVYVLMLIFVIIPSR